MHSVKPWSHPRDYMGATWEGWYSAGFGRSRDSDALEESNFQVASRELLALQGEMPEDERIDNRDADEGYTSVRIVRESHWAVGWVEWIAIHGSDVAALARAGELCDRANDYPVLDEGHFSQLEHDWAGQVWESFSQAERVEYIRKHRRYFEFHSFADLLGCARGKYFAGDAGALLG